MYIVCLYSILSIIVIGGGGYAPCESLIGQWSILFYSILFIELFTNKHCLQLKKITTVSIFIPIVAILLWDLRNNYLFYHLPQFLTFVLFITYILYKVFRSWTIGRNIFFSAEDYTIWIITIVVVLDQSTVTFQKGWGRELLQFVWY